LADLSTRFPSTILRQRFERARSLPVAAQMQECIDYLQNPEVLIQEFVDAYTAVESCCDPEEQGFSLRKPRDAAAAERVKLLDALFGNSAISVFDTEPYAFQCIARDVESLSSSVGGAVQRVDGIDYLGRIVGDESVAVLGVVQAGVEKSAYALFLRMITCLSEIAPDAQLRAADVALFKGSLGEEPKLDLHILLAESECDPNLGALRHLTHDLAEAFISGIAEEWQFPDVLRNIVCLVPSPPGSDETLTVDWLV
jgi:hypothetical protein